MTLEPHHFGTYVKIIWPGLLKSSGVELGDERARTVFALSEADTPIEVPAFASYIKSNKSIQVTSYSSQVSMLLMQLMCSCKRKKEKKERVNL